MVRYNFISEIHLKLPGFILSACRPFLKIKERIHKINERRDYKYICGNELDKACFYHDINYGADKDLAKRKALGKILPVKVFEIGLNP